MDTTESILTSVKSFSELTRVTLTLMLTLSCTSTLSFHSWTDGSWPEERLCHFRG